ncbi:MAG: ankyrin repeat domain-containing protein, partial [Sedimentisphaerales bacterium]|nr:ankyrin repeat domain-containing protein [Sedimentisphaerales bacterium]
MKHIKLFCLALAFVLVAFGCKKKESELQQPAGVQKSEQPAKTPAPAKAIETIEQTQPAQTDTRSEAVETTAAPESTQPNNDPELIKSLQQAVAKGDIEKIQSLIAAGVDVNTKANSGASLLHIALLQGHEAAAASLISKGADTHAIMTDGTSALHFATLRSCKDIAKFLIDDGVDVNAMGANFG